LKLRIEGSAVGQEINCKRLYLDGIYAKALCPHCLTDGVVDFGVTYLSYPTVGAPKRIHFVCANCAHEWSETIQLDVIISQVKEF
jgi:hypothetical protein